MGDFGVRSLRNKQDRDRMYKYCLQDIQSFEVMWAENMFTDGPIHIGAEQELCLVDQNYLPSSNALKFLDGIDDQRYTNELGLYNLEVNLDPEGLVGSCFSTMEAKLFQLIKRGEEHAARLQDRLIMTGILPTLSPKHLDFAYMTPIERYKTLSNTLCEVRGTDFEIYLQGVDELIASLGSVLFEACNTSFQLHLQLKAEEFVDKFNWSQMIAGPVLSCCVNSPLLFGRELWAETRVALFKQSLDTRSSKNHLRKKLPRVYFGSDWLKGSPVELWKNELIRFPLLITSDTLEDSMEVLRQGKVPDLRAIRLHNGTTYTWNRLCYGPSSPAHLRIECRYLPAGPSIKDEMANFAFWVGLMKAPPEDWSALTDTLDFREVKANFIKASRTGLETVFNWMGRPVPADRLILEHLLPRAYKGLEICGCSSEDATHYLGVIEERVISQQTGASWMIGRFRHLKKWHKSRRARQELVAEMQQLQRQNIPVAKWPKQDTGTSLLLNPATMTAGHIMSSDIYAVQEESSLVVVQSIMAWKNIHHLPVENKEGDLVGIITDGILQRALLADKNFAAEIMLEDFVAVEQDTPLARVLSLLDSKKLSCVPVTNQRKLIGLITEVDVRNTSALAVTNN
ncbi:MAG: CBS domain-containing protein [Bacteroidota bacterium]